MLNVKEALPLTYILVTETTYMRYGKGPGRIIRVTAKPRSVHIWSESHPEYSKILKDLNQLRE